MDVLYFLQDHTKFIRNFHNVAIAPFESREKYELKKILLFRLIVRMGNQHFWQNGLKQRQRYRSSAGPAFRYCPIPLNCTSTRGVRS